MEVRVAGEQWREVDSLEEAGPDDRVFMVDRTSATIRFGDGVYGRRPPIGQDVFTADYRVGGGAAGNRGAWTVAAAFLAGLVVCRAFGRASG